MVQVQITKVTAIKETDDYVLCDFCGTLLNVNLEMVSRKEAQEYSRSHPLASTRVSYYHVLTCHHDWDADSEESQQEFDICDKCIETVLSTVCQHPSQTKELKLHMRTGHVPGETLLRMIPNIKIESFKPKDPMDPNSIIA